MYVFYRHRLDAGRELVLPDGGSFPRHLKQDDWYLHGTHSRVNGRTETDIATLGYCDRNAGATFGRKIAAGARPAMPPPTRGSGLR